MNRNILLLLTLLAPLLSLAQINTDTIPKKVNVIEIHTGLSMEENFTLAGQAVAEKSWEITQAHKDIGQIATGKINLDALNTWCKLTILSKAGKIKITGEFTFNNIQIPEFGKVPETSTARILNFGGKNAKAQKAFQTMMDLALKINPDGKQIRFLIEK